MSDRIKLLSHLYQKLVEMRKGQSEFQPSDRQLAEAAERLEAEVHERSDSTTYKSKIAGVVRGLKSDVLEQAAASVEVARASTSPVFMDLVSDSPRTATSATHGSAAVARRPTDRPRSDTLGSSTASGCNCSSAGSSSSSWYGCGQSTASGRSGSRSSSGNNSDSTDFSYRGSNKRHSTSAHSGPATGGAKSDATAAAEPKRARLQAPTQAHAAQPPQLATQPSDDVGPPQPSDLSVSFGSDIGFEEAAFSDEENAPLTPSSQQQVSLEAEHASFALSGVVAADAWQRVCRACGEELRVDWHEDRCELVVNDAVMFHHTIYHASCALTAIPLRPTRT